MSQQTRQVIPLETWIKVKTKYIGTIRQEKWVLYHYGGKKEVHYREFDEYNDIRPGRRNY